VDVDTADVLRAVLLMDWGVETAWSYRDFSDAEMIIESARCERWVGDG
jgi:hypothetical protein